MKRGTVLSLLIGNVRRGGGGGGGGATPCVLVPASLVFRFALCFRFVLGPLKDRARWETGLIDSDERLS